MSDALLSTTSSLILLILSFRLLLYHILTHTMCPSPPLFCRYLISIVMSVLQGDNFLFLYCFFNSKPFSWILWHSCTRPLYVPLLVSSTEAFSVQRGAREGATKVMIVVTDGESHDGEELADALKKCEDRNITRYAIAVSISSHPICNYSSLRTNDH